jgi:hypothetical protein
MENRKVKLMPFESLHFEREDVWKGCRRGIMGEILCTHM